MEPQLFSCGLLYGVSLGCIMIRGFNGAATFQLRIDVGREANIALGRLESFNGAATFQLRIVGRVGSYNANMIASMEPQLFSCGLY